VIPGTQPLTSNPKPQTPKLQATLSHVIPGISERQTFALMRSTIAHSEKGTVNIHELLDSFVLRFASTNSKPAPVGGEWMPAKLHEVGRDILSVQRDRSPSSPSSSSPAVSELLAQFFAEVKCRVTVVCGVPVKSRGTFARGFQGNVGTWY